jgi:hypothetical protein
MLTKDFFCKREVLGKRSPHSFTPPSKCGRCVQHLFRLICFPHNRNIVNIYQLSFIDLHLMINHPPSLNGPYMPTMSTPPQVNYVTTFLMCSTLNEMESLSSPDLDLVFDMVISLIRVLDPDLPTLIEVIDLYSF